MYNLITNLLLGLNLLAVLYLIIRNTSIRGVINNQQNFEKECFEKNNKLIREVVELGRVVERSHRNIQNQIQQLRQERIVENLSTGDLDLSASAQHLLLNDRYKEIFDLKKNGLTVEQIAKELGKGYGEVAFILDLANQDHA